MAGSRKLERDVNDVEQMQGSASEVSCLDNKNVNATEMHQELVTIDILDSLLQPQELQQSSSCHDPLLVFLLMNVQLVKVPGRDFLSEDTVILLRFAQALWSVRYHKLWV